MRTFETFEPNKSAKELGIDPSRKFIVAINSGYNEKGDILKLKRDDGSSQPFFENITNKKLNERYPDGICSSWFYLAYADEPEEVIVSCPTPELFRRVQEKMLGFTEWKDTGKEYFDRWTFHREDSCIGILKKNNFKMTIIGLGYISSVPIPIISAEEYLGDTVKKQEDFKVGDRVRILWEKTPWNAQDNSWRCYLMPEGKIKKINNNDFNPFKVEVHYNDGDERIFSFKPEWLEKIGEEIKPSPNQHWAYREFWKPEKPWDEEKVKLFNSYQPNLPTKKNIMCEIIEKIKSLALSGDDRILRKYGVEDSEGQPTEIGLKMAALKCYADKRAEIIADLKKVEESEKK
jgi:hypothetical protein